MIPSLGIIITEKCNLHCVYCPPNGENILSSSEYCELTSLKDLITIAKNKEIKVVRFTGGEPLLSIVSDRTKELLSHACKLNFDKIILNTNAVYLNENFDWLLNLKDDFLLKISLDTLNKETFKRISGNQPKVLDVILKNIDKAIELGFNIEINSVANIYNIDELNDIVNFCQKKELHFKIFDVFDFGNKVPNLSSTYVNLDSFIDHIATQYESLGNERLPGNRGLSMVKFRLTSSKHLLFVCHEGKYSSSKFFTEDCKTCTYFPCKTGKFQIPIRKNGRMLTCRLNSNNSINISGLNYQEIEDSFIKILDTFKNSINI